MNLIRKKLKSQSGASILIALVLFLVCTMVGAVILSSAAGNADKIRKRSSEQQEYLSLSSAAGLIQKAIGSTVYSGWENNTVYQCYGEFEPLSPEKHSDVADVCTEMTYEINDDAGLKADIAKSVYQAYRSHTTYVTPIAVPSEIEKEFIISGDNMSKVKAKMIFDTNTYNIMFRLTIAEDAVSDYAMTLDFKSTIGPAENDRLTIVKQEQIDKHLRYEYYEDEYGMPQWGWFDTGYDITTYTLKTTVTYDGGTISKGVLPDA